jgi:protein-S-isoprenylcysteine O-methyltransferase Ste14
MPILKIAALLFIGLYFVLIIGLQSYLLYRRTGINAIKGRSKDGAIGFNEKVLSFCTLLLPFIALNFVFFPDNYLFYLVPIPYLIAPWIAQAGIILGFVGLLMAFWAQLQMGEAWRLGLNRKEHTALITRGFYRFSRNPIYLFIVIAYMGFFLMLPNAVSLCFLALSYTAIEKKIRFEEEYLENKHGKAFEQYRNKVRRWI